MRCRCWRLRAARRSLGTGSCSWTTICFARCARGPQGSSGAAGPAGPELKFWTVPEVTRWMHALVYNGSASRCPASHPTQVSKWLGASAASERNYGLQILLSVVSADPDTVGKLVNTPGAVRAVLGALKRAIGGDDDGLFLAAEAVRVLTHSPRFIASMFVAKDAAGLQVILSAMDSSKASGAVALTSPPCARCPAMCTFICTACTGTENDMASKVGRRGARQTNGRDFFFFFWGGGEEDGHYSSAPAHFSHAPTMHAIWSCCVGDFAVKASKDAKVLSFKFDSSQTSNVSVSDDGMVGSSTYYSAYVKGNTPVTEGNRRWWILLQKDSMNDEGGPLSSTILCFGGRPYTFAA